MLSYQYSFLYIFKHVCLLVIRMQVDEIEKDNNRHLHENVVIDSMCLMAINTFKADITVIVDIFIIAFVIKSDNLL